MTFRSGRFNDWRSSDKASACLSVCLSHSSTYQHLCIRTEQLPPGEVQDRCHCGGQEKTGYDGSGPASLLLFDMGVW